MQLRLFIQPLFDWQVEVEVVFQTLLQTFDIPHLLQRLRRNMGIDRRLKDVFADAVDGFADVRHVQQLVTLGVDRPALVVGHIIIFQQLLTDIEVTAFHFTLGVGDRLGDPRVLNRLTWFHSQFTHHARHAIGGEDTHQGIFH